MKTKCDVCDDGIKMPARYHGLDCPKRKGTSFKHMGKEAKRSATSSKPKELMHVRGCACDSKGLDPDCAAFTKRVNAKCKCAGGVKYLDGCTPERPVSRRGTVTKHSAASSKARSADLSGRYAQGDGEPIAKRKTPRGKPEPIQESTSYVKLSVPTLMLTIKRLEEARETAQVVFSATKRRKEAKKIDLVLSRLSASLFADYEADKRGNEERTKPQAPCKCSYATDIDRFKHDEGCSLA